MTTVAATPDDLEKRLQGALHERTLVLSTATCGVPEVDDLMRSLGLEELRLEEATVTPAGSSITVAGAASLFFIDGIGARATFGAGEARSVTLVLEFPAPVAIQVPFIGLGVGGLSVTVSVRGPRADMPMAAIVLGGEVTFNGGALPVTLTPGAGGWTLRAGRIRLPGVSDVASLLGFGTEEIDRLLPPNLVALGGFSLAEFVCVLDPDRWAVSSISATVETASEGDWTLAPFVTLKNPIALTMRVQFPEPPGEDGDASTHATASPVLTGSVTAAMKIGDTLTVPVLVARDGEAWRVGVMAATGFPTVGELVGLMSDKNVVASLPAALASLGLESSSFEVTIPDEGDVSVFFDARLKDHWRIVDGMVEIERAGLQVHVEGDEVGGFLAGTLRFGEHGEVAVPIAVDRSAESASWTLRLACSGRALPGASSLTSLPHGIALPPDLPTLELSEFTVVFGEAPETRKTEVHSMVVRAALDGRWSPPGLGDVGVRDATLAIDVARPADPQRRVDAALRMTIDVAGVPVPIAATWRT